MPRTLITLLATALLAGCVNGRFHEKVIPSAACGGNVSGYSVTYIGYGDSKLVVIPLSKIRVDTEWRFILKPIQLGKSVSGDDYKDKIVRITGKRPLDAWLDTAAAGGNEISGTYNGAADHTLAACVKIVPVPAVGTPVYFVVEVQDIGTLDPRADVY